jgi:hypothetical protein
MDPAEVAQMVKGLNGLAARDALCSMVSCLDETPSDEDREESMDGSIDLQNGIGSV